MRRLVFGGVLLLLFPVLVVAKPAKPKIKDLADSVLSNRITTKFAILLRASNLASFLSSRGPFTLFLPTDSAFSRLKPETFDALQQPQNLEVLQRIVLYHVVNGKMMTEKDLALVKTVPSCEGHPIPVHLTRSGAQLVAKAKILHADIHCANGFIDQVDALMLPPDVSLDKLVIAPVPVPVTNGDANPSPPATNAVSATNSDVTTNAGIALPPMTNSDASTNTEVAPPPTTNAVQ